MTLRCTPATGAKRSLKPPVPSRVAPTTPPGTEKEVMVSLPPRTKQETAAAPSSNGNGSGALPPQRATGSTGNQGAAPAKGKANGSYKTKHPSPLTDIPSPTDSLPPSAASFEDVLSPSAPDSPGENFSIGQCFFDQCSGFPRPKGSKEPQSQHIARFPGLPFHLSCWTIAIRP